MCQIPEELELGAEPLPVAPGGVQTAQDIHRAPDQRGGPPRQGKNIPAAFAQYFAVNKNLDFSLFCLRSPKGLWN